MFCVLPNSTVYQALPDPMMHCHRAGLCTQLQRPGEAELPTPEKLGRPPQLSHSCVCITVMSYMHVFSDGTNEHLPCIDLGVHSFSLC